MKWAISCQSGHRLVVWVFSFIEPDLFDDSVLFDMTATFYLINLLCKLFAFFMENNENYHLILNEFYVR